MTTSFVEQLDTTLREGGFTMVNATRVHRAMGNIEGEQLHTIWRDSMSAQGDHLGLLTSEAFYTVKITGMGIRYSLSTQVRYSDLVEATWSSSIQPGFVMVVAQFRMVGERPTHYVVGSASNEMERQVVERKAEHLVSTVNRLAKQREDGLQAMVDGLRPLMDEVEELLETSTAGRSASSAEMSDDARRVAQVLSASGGSTLDELGEALNMTLQEVSVAMKEVEIAQNVVRMRGGIYRFSAGLPKRSNPATEPHVDRPSSAPSSPPLVTSDESVSPALSVSERIEKLESAAGLLDRGLISSEDFERLRGELLDED